MIQIGTVCRPGYYIVKVHSDEAWVGSFVLTAMMQHQLECRAVEIDVVICDVEVCLFEWSPIPFSSA